MHGAFFIFLVLITLKVGSGEIPISEDEWEDIDEGVADDDEGEEEAQSCSIKHSNESVCEIPHPLASNFCKRNAMICPIYNVSLSFTLSRKGLYID